MVIREIILVIGIMSIGIMLITVIITEIMVLMIIVTIRSSSKTLANCSAEAKGLQTGSLGTLRHSPWSKQSSVQGLGFKRNYGLRLRV